MFVSAKIMTFRSASARGEDAAAHFTALIVETLSSLSSRSRLLAVMWALQISILNMARGRLSGLFVSCIPI